MKRDAQSAAVTEQIAHPGRGEAEGPGRRWFFIGVGLNADSRLSRALDAESATCRRWTTRSQIDALRCAARRGPPAVSDRALRRRPPPGVVTAGIATAGYLTYVHYEPAALICTGSGGCETVQDSDYAVLAGVPIAVLGLGRLDRGFALTVWDSELARTLTTALALGALAFVGLPRGPAAVRDRRDLRLVHANDVVLVPLFAVLAVLQTRRALGRSPRPRSSEPGAGCPTGCGRGSPSVCRPSR